MKNHIGIGIKALLLIGLCGFSLTGCILTDQKANDLFTKKIPVPIGKDLEVTLIGEKPTSSQSPIILDVKNISKDCIVFPFDYGTQIYAYFHNDWSNISNSIEYPSHDDIPLTAAGGSNSEVTVFAKPNYSPVPASSYPVKIRIVVNGRLCKGGVPSGDQTAGYLELTINKP